MERSRRLLLLLCAAAAVAADGLGHITEGTGEDAMAAPSLPSVIPKNNSRSSVRALVMEERRITLNEEDRRALATYPNLVELHLDGNLVTAIAAKYFSVVPNLRVLSLSRNNISSLHPEAFLHLRVLTELDLSHNLLASLPPTLFRGLHSLQVLKLQENPWNCSCPLLTPIQEVKEANVKFGGPQPACASPDQQAKNPLLNATADCYPEQTPALGNTWKFTVCVAALALTTSMLVVFGIKGPSWYKRFHNYRHRRLDRGEDEEENAASSNPSGTGRLHQTFRFSQGREHEEEEEEEEEYYEDPYVQREDGEPGARSLQ